MQAYWKLFLLIVICDVFNKGNNYCRNFKMFRKRQQKTTLKIVDQILSICIFFHRHWASTRQKQTQEVFYKEGVLKNVEKFTGKHLRQGLFFNKVAG